MQVRPEAPLRVPPGAELATIAQSRQQARLASARPEKSCLFLKGSWAAQHQARHRLVCPQPSRSSGCPKLLELFIWLLETTRSSRSSFRGIVYIGYEKWERGRQLSAGRSEHLCGSKP